MSTPSGLRVQRDALLADRTLRGAAWCRAYSAAADAWLTEVLGAACGGDTRKVCLLAVGGYGRGELAPGSDLDLLLVHDLKPRDIKAVAEAVWYPIWDEGIHLDHSVRTVKEIRAAADSDLKVALGLVDARVVAGDGALGTDVARRIADLWQTRAGRWLPEVDAHVRERHRTQGDVAFLLEPDLKEGRGGLRDLYTLHVAARVSPVLAGLTTEPLTAAGAVLAAARVELQRSTGKESSRLLLQEQDVVAAALDMADADALMVEVCQAARIVAWASDDAWRRVLSWLAGPHGRGGSADRPIEPGLVLRDDEVALTTDADPAGDPSLALRAAAASAELDRPMARATLDRLGRGAVTVDGEWPEAVLQAWLRLLGAGPPAVAAIESLDQLGVWVKLLREWAAVRNRPQRNAYHRFTVDRHLVETAVNASTLVRRVSRPDLLLAGAILHDIGKGRGGDHTEIGIALVREMGPRLGFSYQDTEVLAAMVRHHLLLPDVATRRDLDDPRTISFVAEAAGDLVTLQLLAGLTEADSLATGSSAWGPWKAGLVAELVRRTEHVLTGHEPDVAPASLTPAQRRLLEQGGLHVVADGDQLTVVAPDQSGLLATVSGVLSLSGVQVRSAATRSSPTSGTALLAFEVAAAFDRLPDWRTVESDLAAALDGRLALEERLDVREQQYARWRRVTSAGPTGVVVTLHDNASAVATVVEVRALDAGPVLYRIARAIADAGLFISWARVATLGAEVIDVFYVQTPQGGKLPDDLGERAALVTSISEALGAPPAVTTD